MDSPPSTGAATSPASHPPAAGREQLPHVSDSSSHNSAVPLPLMGPEHILQQWFLYQTPTKLCR